MIKQTKNTSIFGKYGARYGARFGVSVRKMILLKLKFVTILSKPTGNV